MNHSFQGLVPTTKNQVPKQFDVALELELFKHYLDTITHLSPTNCLHHSCIPKHLRADSPKPYKLPLKLII